MMTRNAAVDRESCFSLYRTRPLDPRSCVEDAFKSVASLYLPDEDVRDSKVFSFAYGPAPSAIKSNIVTVYYTLPHALSHQRSKEGYEAMKALRNELMDQRISVGPLGYAETTGGGCDKSLFFFETDFVSLRSAASLLLEGARGAIRRRSIHISEPVPEGLA